ncbi:SDR family oxidoreductase [Kiritimatiellota bacterium B12222]|nr:SDR family oxidoreductase [Kiritimatiellota bacterium B12222]
MKTLINKVALVTGSSRGIGAEIAKSLAQAGAKVVVNYANSASEAEKVVAEIQAEGGDAIAIRANVCHSAEVRALFESTIAHFGKVDILVNNAGVMLNKKIQDTSDEEFDQLFDINVKGTFYSMREAATRLEDGGRVINFSSTTTRLMLPTYGSYCASKGAVEQLSRIFAKEVGARGITVNTLSPGPTNTELFTQGKTEAFIQQLADMSALGRIAEPSDIAQVVLFLASDAAQWISGQNIGANGGLA